MTDKPRIVPLTSEHFEREEQKRQAEERDRIRNANRLSREERSDDRLVLLVIGIVAAVVFVAGYATHWLFHG